MYAVLEKANARSIALKRVFLRYSSDAPRHPLSLIEIRISDWESCSQLLVISVQSLVHLPIPSPYKRGIWNSFYKALEM